ncbi:MAG: hypothetical protein OZ917_11335 [Candidatus Brocadiaceae bacterium]|nr:hypothetical protein [Candidatus Brocadiaceae bacterium]
MGGWRRNGWKARCMNQGYLIERVTVLGGRAFIVARKHRNRCGAKGVKTFVPDTIVRR